MTSPAAEIAAICEESLDAIESGRLDDLDALTARLGAVGHPESAGSLAEIECALAATRRLHELVEKAARETSLEIEHAHRGKRALAHYGKRPAKDPRAIDMSI